MATYLHQDGAIGAGCVGIQLGWRREWRQPCCGVRDRPNASRSTTYLALPRRYRHPSITGAWDRVVSFQNRLAEARARHGQAPQSPERLERTQK